MTTEAIDLDKLNELFDNQKKLDDIFNSTFDDDSFLISTISDNDDMIGCSGQQDSQDLYSNDDLLFNPRDNFFVPKKRSIVYFVMPVMVEIAVIYYGIMYFTGLSSLG